MEISTRLQMVVGEINCEALADIGTDHGYIPIYAIKTGRAKRAIACDVKVGPLGRARENIKLNNLDEIVETRLGSGLRVIEDNEVDCVSIAGMGGMLMIDILREREKLVMGLNRLVLQPQRDIKDVRKYLHQIGFRIINEEMTLDIREGMGSKFYTVITSEPGIDDEYSAEEYLFGKLLILRKDDVLRKFLLNRISTYEKIIAELSKDSQRFIEINEQIKISEGVVECL